MGVVEGRRNPGKTRCLQLVAGGQNSWQGPCEARHPLVLPVTLSSVESLVQEHPDTPPYPMKEEMDSRIPLTIGMTLISGKLNMKNNVLLECCL